MAVLTPTELTEQLKTLAGWSQAGDAIRKEFTFQDFPEAVLFVSALVPGMDGFLAKVPVLAIVLVAGTLGILVRSLARRGRAG